MDSYEKLAPFYDKLELDESGSTQGLNRFLKELLDKYHIHYLADVACGTGAQSLELCKYYQVQASDLSPAMIKMAQSKWKENSRSYSGRSCISSPFDQGTMRVRKEFSGAPISFEVADMCHVKVGHCEAVIAMYNAIGHLSRCQWVETLQKWLKELKPPQLIIMDAFSADYFKNENRNPDAYIESKEELGLNSMSLDFEGYFQGKELKRWVRSEVVNQKQLNSTESYLSCIWKTQWGNEYFTEESKVRLISEAELRETYLLLKKENPQLKFALKSLSQGDMYLFYLYHDDSASL